LTDYFLNPNVFDELKMPSNFSMANVLINDLKKKAWFLIELKRLKILRNAGLLIALKICT